MIFFTSLSFELLQHLSLGKTDERKRQRWKLFEKIVMRDVLRFVGIIRVLYTMSIQWLIEDGQRGLGWLSPKSFANSIPAEKLLTIGQV